MGTMIDDFLEKTGSQHESAAAPTPSVAPPPVDADTEVGKFISNSDARAKLGLSYQYGIKQSPDQATRILRMQAKTGLPQDLIERKLDEVEQESKKADFNPDQFYKTSPMVASWLAEHPNHVAAASDDLQKLGYLERQFKNISEQYQQGKDTLDLSDIGESAILGSITPEQRRRQAEIEDRQAQFKPEVFGITGAMESVPGAVANQLPQLVQTIKGTAESAAAGAVGGAAVGAGAGLLAGGVGAIPGALAGAGTGATLGYDYGAALVAGRMESNLAYLSMEKMKDENGMPLDRDTMLGASAITGVVNGALTLIPFHALAKNVPGLRALSREGISALLENPTVRSAFAHYAKNVAEETGKAGGIGWVQQMIRSSAQELATMYQDGSLTKMSSGAILSRLFSDENLAKAKESALTNAEGGGGTSAALGVTALSKDYHSAKAAQANAESFKAIGEGIKSSKLFERLPDQTQELVARLVKDGPSENVYAPIEAWNTYWQGKGVDPRAVAQEVIGKADGYDEAMQSGHDLAIPTEKYATKIAPTEHNEFFVKELRADPLAMNQREAEEFSKRVTAQEESKVTPEEQKTQEQSGKVGEQIGEQLKKAGFDEGTAGTYAKLYETAFRSLAQRTGQDPLELFQQYGLQVQREGQVELEQQGQMAGNASPELNGSKIDHLDSILDRIRSGDVPSDREVRGKTLVEFLREKGGIRPEDEGLDIQKLEPDQGKRPFTKNLIKDGGLAADKAAVLAHESGYLAEADINELIQGVDDEIRGKPRYSAQNENSSLAERRSVLDHVKNSLSSLGVDLGKTDNATAKTLLAQEKNVKVSADDDHIFLQPGDDGERGRIRFAPGKFNIDLFKTADLSTFLHETGHFYLEVLGDLATGERATDQVKQDYASILKWMGVESRDQIKTEHHEQWARGFEVYLMEGKAPTSELRQAFARFRAWLLSVYRQVKNLSVDLSPEVKGVMDRLLATEEEIRAAEHEQGMQPLFPDPKAVGMNAKEAESYSNAILEARNQAEEKLASRFMEEVTREQKARWKEQRDIIREQVATEVNSDPTYIALAVLQKGLLPDGSPLPEGMQAIKLSKESLVREYGKEFLKRLPKPYVYSAEGGVHQDIAAEVLGFRSGEELVMALANAQKREQLIEANTDARMKELHGDLQTDGRLPLEAMKAVHTEKRAELLRKELQILASQNLPAFKGLIRKITRRIPTIEMVRDQAEQTIARKAVREINPLLYQRAEASASKEAVQAMLRGDFEAAFDAKQRELLNHEMYRAASNAREQVDSIVEYMNKFGRASTRERLAKAGEGYLDQIDSILDRFDFRKGISLKAIDRRKSLLEFVQEQRELGVAIDMPQRLLNEAYRQHFKDTSYEELTGVHDAVKNIEHLAQLKNTLLAAAKSRDLEAAKTEVISSISAFHDISSKPAELAPGIKDRLIENVSGAIAAHTRMEFLFEHLDGGKAQGPVWEHLFKPMADAENHENEMVHRTSAELAKVFEAYPRSERATWFYKKIFVPEARTDKISGNFTKANILAIALNWGNAYNRDALMRGYGWTEAQVKAILSKLDARDWKTVQGVWDHLESYWPQVEKLQKDLTGLAPEKVEATPVETEHGTFPGGYYPIVFDSKLSWRQNQLEEKANVQDMFGGNWSRAMTRHGHTEARTDTGGKPLRLELTGLTNHLGAVIHDLAYRPAIIDVSRIINQPDVRDAISAAAGRDMYKQLNPWLAGIAGDRRGEPMNPIEGIMGRARMGATTVALGLKVTSALVQTIGYTLSVKELGPKYAMLGLRDAFGKPWEISKSWGFITERSKMMESRIENYDRDVRDAMKKLSIAGTQPGALSVVEAYSHGIRNSFFHFTGYMDLATSIPTWLGAYRKAMDGGMENIAKGDEKAAVDYADSIVRQTQSAGGSKDLAGIQRGSESFKLFTMFYSQLSLLFNQFEKTHNQFRLDRNVPKLVGSLAMTWFVPAVLEELIRGQGPSPDDSDEKKAQWLMRKELLYPFGSVILARDISNSLDRYLQTGKVDYSGSPAFGAMESMVKGLAVLAKPITGQEIERQDVKNAVMATGYATALPSSQLWKTGEYLYDWMTGEERPETPVEGVWRAVIAGKKRD
jgi:hypothetical protein